MSNSNENIHDNLAEPRRKSGIIKKTGAALVAAGVLGGGVAAVKAGTGEELPPATTAPRDTTEQSDPVPVSTVVTTTVPESEMPPVPGKTDDGKVPGPINEPGEPDVAGTGPEIGTAAMVEKATTPEQNAEFQMSATALATSVIDLYSQGIGNRNFVHNNDESGRQIINVINDANDKSGYYVLTAELPTGSMDPADAFSVTVLMVQGETDDNKTVDANNDGYVDNRTSLYSMYLDNNSGTGWELGYEVDASIDVGAAVGPQSKQPQVDFAQQVISRAADGAPVS